MKKVPIKYSSMVPYHQVIYLAVLFLLSLLLTHPIGAIENTPENFIAISSVIHRSGNLAPGVSYFIDSSSNLSLTDIEQKEHAGEFNRGFDASSSLTYPDGAIWLKLALINDVEDGLWYISTINDRVRQLDAYMKDNTGNLVHQKLGLAVRGINRSTGFNNANLKIKLEKGERTTIFLRIESRGVFRTNLFLYNDQELWEQSNLRTIFLGCYAGIIISLVIYNLFLFLSLKDISYLNYIFFSMSMLMVTLVYHAIGDIIGIPAPNGLWIDHIETIRTFPLITGALFIATFFRLKQTLPFWNNFMLSFVLFSIIIFVISLFSSSTLIPFAVDLLNLLTLVVAITIGVIMLRAGFQPARYFLLSWIIFGFGVLIWSISNLGLIPAYFVIRQAPQLAGIFEIIFMSLALAQRLRQYERVEFELEQKVIENERTRRFIHILFHDLANPLSVALGLIQHLKKKSSDHTEKSRAFYDHITNALDAMKETVDGVRTLESLRFDNRSLKLESINAVEAIQKAIDIYSEKLENKGLVICKEGFDSKTVTIKANLGLFKNEIIGNLLSNAIKFSRRGGTIHFAIKELQDEIMFLVADDGIGIPADSLSSLFETSHKNSRPGTEGESGSGFGMPIVKESIAYCGARLEVESQVSSGPLGKGGTTFRLFFQKVNS